MYTHTKSPVKICLTGRAGAGKDTFADLFADRLATKDKRGIERFAFADAVKDALYRLNPRVAVLVVEEEDAESRTYITDYPYTEYPKKIHTSRLTDVVDALGWDEAKKLPEIRSLLQRMGTEAGRNIHGENTWIYALDNEIRDAQLSYSQEGELLPHIIITDARFENEVQFARHLGCTIVEVRRDVRTTSTPSHVSEMLDTEADYVIDNNGSLSDLKELARRLYWHL